MNYVVLVQLPIHVWLFETPWTANQASPSLTISQSWSIFMFVASVMPSSHFILWCPLLLLPLIFPSLRDISNEYSRLISLKIDWFDLLAVKGTLRSLLQHHSSKASIFHCSAFFTVQLSRSYTEKTTALTTAFVFVGRVMSLLFNTLPRFVTAFLPRSNHLISWLQSPFAVFL